MLILLKAVPGTARNCASSDLSSPPEGPVRFAHIMTVPAFSMIVSDVFATEKVGTKINAHIITL